MFNGHYPTAGVPAVVGTAKIGVHGFLVSATPSRPVSYTHLDVYKRQIIKFYFRFI